MKQGILLKIENKKMILLTEEGEFIERPLPKSIPPLGSRVFIPAEKSAPNWQRLSIVAILLIFVLSFSVLRPALIPSAVASVAFDLPVGIELDVDQKNRVVKVNPKDEKAKLLLKELDLEGEDVYLAANQLVEATFTSLDLSLNQGDGGVLITVMPLKKRGRMALDHHRLHEQLGETLSGQDFHGYLILQNSDENLREKAAALDLPIGKYLLWERIGDLNDEITSLEDLRAISMEDLIPQDEEVLEKRFPGMWHHMGCKAGMMGSDQQSEGHGMMGPGHHGGKNQGRDSNHHGMMRRGMGR